MFLSSRIVSLVGAAGLFFSSFMTWYWSEGDYRRTENAWQGEESLAAIIVMLVAVTILAVGWAWRSGWLAMGIIELLLCIGSFGLTIFFILYNREPVVVYGRTLPTGIGPGAWVGLVSSVAMIVGAVLYLCSGGPTFLFNDDYDYEVDEDDEDFPPRRRRGEYEDRDEDDWPPPRPRRPRPPVRRRPPRHRGLHDE